MTAAVPGWTWGCLDTHIGRIIKSSSVMHRVHTQRRMWIYYMIYLLHSRHSNLSATSYQGVCNPVKNPCSYVLQNLTVLFTVWSRGNNERFTETMDRVGRFVAVFLHRETVTMWRHWRRHLSAFGLKLRVATTTRVYSHRWQKRIGRAWISRRMMLAELGMSIFY